MDETSLPVWAAMAPVFMATVLLLVLVFATRWLEKRLQPMAPHVSAVTFSVWITRFTFGFALLSTKIPMLKPFGLILIYLGIAPFISDWLIASFIYQFVVALGLALGTFIFEYQKTANFLDTTVKPTNTFFYGVIVVWGVGVTFACRRWQATRRTLLPPTPLTKS